MRKFLVLTFVPLIGCGNIMRKIEHPELYGTALQVREAKKAAPCKAWCHVMMHLPGDPLGEDIDMMVKRGGDDGRMCLCTLHYGEIPTSTESEFHSFQKPVSWYRGRLPMSYVDAFTK